MEGETSIADMIRDAANEVLHSRVPEGFQWVEAYGQYYSPSCGFFYDPNTGLFYHHDSETYYIFNDDTQQYEVYKCMRKTHWTSSSNKKKAKEMFAGALDRFDQDAVDVCEVVFDLTSKLSLEEKEAENHGSDSDSEAFSKIDIAHEQDPSTEYFDEATGEMVTVPSSAVKTEPMNSKERRKERRRKAREALRNGGFDADGDVDDSSEEEDERIQMREDEGFSQPPLLRIIDSKNNLHVITICGGIVGRQSGCDIVIEDPTISRKLLEFVFVPESNSFVVNKVSDKGHVALNDYELKANDERELEHGDFLRFGSEFLRIHVHFGNNTCTGCEPGLLRSDPNSLSQTLVVPRGETARRRNLKAIKAMYGINDYAENARNPHHGIDRAAKRRKLVGSVMDVNGDGSKITDPNDIYQGCAAKPIPGLFHEFGIVNQNLVSRAIPFIVGAVVPPSNNAPVKPLNEANKGFRLLQSMGWKEGEGLGREGQGRQQPVETTVRKDRQGLGTAEEKAQPKTRNDVILEKTKERYEKVRFLEVYGSPSNLGFAVFAAAERAMRRKFARSPFVVCDVSIIFKDKDVKC
ncbi:g-patch domain protein [Ancylostoma caninum]|uniref:G-patch domain protein n=1 Tax=Ancylostoma caninum TaxID=29170 RepID=A0A368H061_ANCCA|nr:g-patch domain protein [Ancylostoma caninum]